jgi:hypothetical protein
MTPKHSGTMGVIQWSGPRNLPCRPRPCLGLHPTAAALSQSAAAVGAPQQVLADQGKQQQVAQAAAAAARRPWGQPLRC